MKYNIKTLISMPVIRTDKNNEIYNKLTDLQIKEYEDEIDSLIKEEKKDKNYIVTGADFLAKIVDREIFYKLIKTNKVYLK